MTEQQDSALNEPQNSSGSTVRRGIAFLWKLLLVIVVLAAAVAAVYFYQPWNLLPWFGDESQPEVGLEEPTEAMETAAANNNETPQIDWQTELATLEAKIESRLDAVDQMVLNQVSAESNRNADLPRAESSWHINSIELMLQQANFELATLKDPDASLQSLRSALHALEQNADARLSEVQLVIRQEIDALESFPRVNFRDAFAKIDNLKIQIDDLTPNTPSYRSQPTSVAEDDENSAEGNPSANENRGLLNALFIIRKHADSTIAPLLTEQEALLLKQRLYLSLDMVQMALLRRDSQLYDTSMRHTDELFLRYVGVNSPSYTVIKRELDDLKNLQIDPEFPDISYSLNRVRELRASAGSEVSNEARPASP